MNILRSVAAGFVMALGLAAASCVTASRLEAQAPAPESLSGSAARTAWPPAVERTLWRAPLTALDPEPPARRSEVAAAGSRSCLRGGLIGGGVGAVAALGWLVVAGEGDLFEGPRERNFALIAVGAGALIGCALASD